jgi:two-component system, sensor histidine kinase and response regulator
MLTTSTDPSARAKILIVDDMPVNRLVLTEMLRKEQRYDVRPASGGPEALEMAQADPPDLILLDIMMPDLSGYDVCERLKADERLKDIPVIFISALSEPLDKVRAFAVGGLDYVTKPFQLADVRARVETHLKLRRLQLEQRENLEKLRESECLRDNLVHMMVHDMRQPLSSINNSLYLLKARLRGKLGEREERDLGLITGSVNTLVEMLSAMLDVSRLESGQMPLQRTDCDLQQALSEALRLLAGLASKCTIEVTPAPARAYADLGVTSRILINLLGNALKFTPPGGLIRVSFHSEGEWVRVAVSDAGPGIPSEHQARVFQKFGQLESRQEGIKYSTGLGLTFCKMAVEAQGGQIGLQSEPGQGSTFWFTLPRSEVPPPGSVAQGQPSEPGQ